MPRSHKLRIIVAGAPLAGKTTVAMHLLKTLREQGFVAIARIDPHENAVSTAQVLSTLPQRVHALKEAGLEIVIEQRQVFRDGKLASDYTQEDEPFPWMTDGRIVWRNQP